MSNELNTEQLSLDFLRVCEAAAIASARTMGQGDRRYSDHMEASGRGEIGGGGGEVGRK